MSRSQSLKRFAIIACITCLASACGAEDQACPALTYPGAPIVTVLSVVDAQTGEEIEDFTLSSFIWQGGSVGAASLIDGVPDNHASLDGDVLHCNKTCGFGKTYGGYEFNVGAPGYISQKVAILGEYSSSYRDGCKTYLIDGSDVAVELDKAGS
jgi:hypothetical protein